MNESKWPSLGIALLGSAFFAFPFAWMLMTAVRPPEELWSIPPWLPSRMSLESFRRVLEAPDFLRSLMNSMGLGIGGSLIVLILALPGAYALARGPLRRRQGLMHVILGLSLLPPVCLVGGLYQIYASLGWINRIWALAIPLAALQMPFTLWLLTPALARVPRELEEAAWLDGCSRGRAFVQIVIPTVRGSIVSAGLLGLAFIWNEFLLGYSLTFDEAARPATVAVALLRGSFQQPWGELCAAAAIVALPLSLMVFLLQGRLVSGLSAGLGKEG